MVNRIIGILVLLALAVLVSPVMVSHYDAAVEAEMVKAPAFPNQQAQSSTIQALTDNETLAPSVTSKLSKTLKVKNHGTKVADANWVVQVATFKDKVAALGLANQLRAKGYNAFIHQKNAAFGEEIAVFIGPEGKKELAEALAHKLAKETNLSTAIKNYKPLAA